MKIFFKSALFLSSLALGAAAQADFIESSMNQVIDFIQSQGGEKLCQKGDASAGVFSVRSFEGNLCKVPVFAAFSVLMCGNKTESGYLSSGCYKNALKALGANSDNVMMKAKLLLKLKKKQEDQAGGGGGGSGDVDKLLCSNMEALQSFSSEEEIKAICGK